MTTTTARHRWPGSSAWCAPGRWGRLLRPGTTPTPPAAYLQWQRGRGDGGAAAHDVEFARFEALTQELLKVSKAELDRRRTAG